MPDKQQAITRDRGSEASSPLSSSIYDKTTRLVVYTICVGNPIDGFRLLGLFADANEAVEWADSIADTWHVMPIMITPDSQGVGLDLDSSEASHV